jgi:hypothetical protein
MSRAGGSRKSAEIVVMLGSKVDIMHVRNRADLAVGEISRMMTATA